MRSASFRHSLWVLGLASVLALSACATSNTSGDSASGASPSQLATLSDSDAAVISADPAPEAEPVLTPVPDPASLVGHSEASLERLFGTPSFTRRDPPAELWQYRNATCTLDLFLYESAGVYSVEHLEFREAIFSKAEIEHCLRTIIEQKQTAG